MYHTLTLSILLFVSFGAIGMPTQVDAAGSLRSAFLGPTVWEDGLPRTEVNQQLRDHFAEVVERLEAQNASSLLTALLRAEATSSKEWTKFDRAAALLALAHNRQKQIVRLKAYADRGLFPLNEGQSTTAAPIFVDRHHTHCAVGYLMHVDGRDAEVAEVVQRNNLVKVMDAKMAGLANWVRTSGLTLEEAAMIQPGYPLDLNATFEDFFNTTPTVERNGLTVTSATLRGSRFHATPANNFQTNPNAINDILEQGKAALEINNVVGTAIRSNVGFLFDDPPSYALLPPDNLDDWLYIGSNDGFFGGFIGNANSNGNVGIVEIEYELSSSRGNFSQIALTSSAGSEIDGETSALLVLSEFFDSETSDLLGQARLFVAGRPNVNGASASLSGSEAVQLNSDSVRIRTYGLVVGSNISFEPPLHSFYHEFETATLVGDFDSDGNVNVDDLDRFNQNIGAEATGTLTALDLDGDGFVGANDFETHYSDLVMTSNGQVGTVQGDANLDGRVDVLRDGFTLVSNLNGTSITSWSQCDFNGDGAVNIFGDAFSLVANLGFSNAP